MIAAHLEIDPDAVVGKLIRLWTWFDIHTLDGNAPLTQRALVERSVGCVGFIDAVVLAGWLHIKKDRIVVHDFGKFISKSAKKRALGRQRSAVHASQKTNAPSVSASSSSSHSSFKKEKSSRPKKPQTSADLKVPDYLATDTGRKSIDEWLDHRRDIGKPATVAMMGKLFKQHESADSFSAAVDHSIGGGYQGLFEPRGNAHSGKTPALPQLPITDGSA